MLMQGGMRQELWVQEERYEVPQWVFLQWELLRTRRVRVGGMIDIRIDVRLDYK